MPFVRLLDTADCDAHTEGLRLTVGFWQNKASHDASEPPVCINDFHWPNMFSTYTRIVTNANGHYKLLQGGWVDPADIAADPESYLDTVWEYETVPTPIANTVRSDLLRYWNRRQDAEAAGTPYPQNHATDYDKLGSDPRGVIVGDIYIIQNNGITI